MKTLYFFLLLALSISSNAQKLSPVKNDKGLWGYADDKGKIVIDCKYDVAYPFSDGLALVKSNIQFYIVDTLNKLHKCDEFKYDRLFVFEKHEQNIDVLPKIVPVSEWAFINEKGKTLIKGKYHNALPFKNEMALVQNGNSYAYINKTGKLITNYWFNHTVKYSEELAKIQKNGKYGFIDLYGKTVIECKYDSAGDFHFGLAVVKENNAGKYLYSYIDKSGKKVSEQFEYAFDLKDEMGLVKKWNLYGYVDKTGKTIIPCMYQKAGEFSENKAFVGFYTENNDRAMLIDKTGKIILKIGYNKIYPFREGIARVTGGSTIFINHTGEKVINGYFNDGTDFSEGIAAVLPDSARERTYYFIDKTGKLLFNNGFQYVETFKDGIVKVGTGSYNEKKEFIGEMFYIDKTGKEIYNQKDNIFLLLPDHLFWAGSRECFNLFHPKIKDNSLLCAQPMQYIGVNYGIMQSVDKYSLLRLEDTQNVDWYDQIIPVNDTLAIVKKEEKKAIINLNSEIISDWYDDISEFTDGFAIVKKDYKENYLGLNMKPLTEWVRMCEPFKNGVAKLENDHDYWLINKKGERITDKYLSISEFKNGRAVVFDNTKYNIIDYSGKLVDEWKQEIFYPMENANIIVQTNIDLFKEYAIFDKKGNMLSDWSSNKIVFSDGLAKFRKDQKWGFINDKGIVIIQPEFDNEPLDFADDLSSIVVNDKFGFIDKSGKVVITPQFFVSENFSEGMARIGDEAKSKYLPTGKFGYIDKTGKKVINLNFDCAGKFSEGLSSVCKKIYDNKLKDSVYKFGYIDKTGKTVIDFKFSDFEYFSNPKGGLYEPMNFIDGVASVCMKEEKEKYFIIDKTGKILAELKYKFQGDTGYTWFRPATYSEGYLLAISENKRFAYFDKSGNILNNTFYDYGFPFKNGLAITGKGLFDNAHQGVYGLIDKTGKQIVQFYYDEISDFSENIARVKDCGKYGFIDITGKEIVKPVFEYAHDFKNGKAWVKQEGLWFYIDKNGNKIE